MNVVDRIRADAASVPSLPVASADIWAAIRRRRAVRTRSLALGGGSLLAISAGFIATSPWPGGPAPGSVVAATPGPVECDRGCVTGGENENLYRQQDKAAPYLQRIHAIADEDEDFGSLGIGFDPLTIEITWHGEVPSEVSSILGEAEAAGIEVETVDAPYRLADLEHAASALIDALDLHGIRVLTVGPSQGLSGVAVGSSQLMDDPQAQATVRIIARETIGDIPVVFIPGEPSSGFEGEDLVPEVRKQLEDALRDNPWG